MFISYKGREALPFDLVAVHFNSHKNTFSIVKMDSENTIGRVLGYANQITLTKCRFKIDKTKQQSVINTGVKDRHAFVVGYLKDFKFEKLSEGLYYKPTVLKSFINIKEKDNPNPEYLEQVDKVSFSVSNEKPIVRFNY